MLCRQPPLFASKKSLRIEKDARGRKRMRGQKNPWGRDEQGKKRDTGRAAECQGM